MSYNEEPPQVIGKYKFRGHLRQRLQLNDQEYLLYDFFAKQGDTLSLYVFCTLEEEPLLIDYLIKEKYEVNMNGNLIDKIVCEAINPVYGKLNTYTYYERIGSEYGLVETYACGENQKNHFLRCYEDRFINYKTDMFKSYGDFDCYYFVTSTSDLQVKERISIYPNPVTTEFYIESKTLRNNSTISIFNLDGQLIKTLRDQNPINVEDLKSGVFLVQIDTGANRFVQKMVKM